MSATGRNLPGNERHTRDFYETPAWVTKAILPHLHVPSPRHVIDAGAGTGAILRECCHFWPNAQHAGIEFDPERAQSARQNGLPVFLGDWLIQNGPKVDLVIANPPYKLALPFAEKALELGAEVAFLLRLNWLAGKSRRAFHQQHPADIFVLSKRPSFTGGGTDATEYAWFVWGPGRGNRWSVL